MPLNTTFEACTNDESFVVHSPSKVYIINSILTSAINLVFSIIGIALNVLVIVTFCTTKKIRSKITFFMIAILSCNDLAVVMIVQPLFLLHYITEVLGRPNCWLRVAYLFSVITFSGMSATTLTIMNVERYIAITHPVYHRTKLTKTKCLKVLLLSWSLVLTLSVLRFQYPAAVHGFISVAISFIIVATTYIYVRIFQVGRRSALDATSNTRNSELMSSVMHSLRALKMAKTYFVIVLLCSACYLPTVINFVLGIVFNGEGFTISVQLMINMWCDTGCLINSSMNCVVFFWSNKELKKHGSKLLKKSLKL